MRVSSLLALVSATLVAAAPSPVPEDANSYLKSDGSNAARSLNKRICEGVYMCDGQNFSGSCYYGCYPISVGIYPDSYWVSSISSVGPDNGDWCDFYQAGSGCDATKGSHQIFRYPGGNLGSGIDNNMGCFYCNLN
ncbi:hypothetical protein CSAL01_07094 [Colletotrichum salicis]|uniref:Uncharacterized protein n=1 Tax=Colletotrichum salicis TaxID=1209931 RepID=A0A135SE89_9PEZI|nr:hypothetical protein CSAL01_07094 [Colletotrichum salicis]